MGSEEEVGPGVGGTGVGGGVGGPAGRGSPVLLLRIASGVIGRGLIHRSGYSAWEIWKDQAVPDNVRYVTLERQSPEGAPLLRFIG